MEFKQSVGRFFRNCWRVIKYSYKRYVGDQLGKQAIVLTYYTLFSIVPLIALIFGISKGFGFNFSVRAMLIDRFPAHAEMLNYVCDLAEWTLQEASGGVVAGVGVIALLWTVVWLINNIENAFGVVWGLPSRRGVLRKFSNYLSLVLLTPIMMVAVSTLGMMLREKVTEFVERFPENHVEAFFWETAADVVPILATILLFLFVYLRMPDTKVRWGGACVAAVFTGICFQILQFSFLWLQSWVFTYNRLYGGFAILPLFLIWVNWSWQLILFGAEISFVQQHLKSGVFNESRRKISNRLRRIHQLAVLRRIYAGFEEGNGAMPASEVAAILRVPEMVLRSEVNELIDCGMICRSEGKDGELLLLPGMPPDKLTVIDFMREINGSGDDENAEFAAFERLFCRMERVIENSECNLKIHEV